MSYFPSKILTEQALAKRSTRLQKSVAATSLAVESVDKWGALDPYGEALKYANDHITIDKEEINKAEAAYQEVGKYLIRKLQWDEDDIDVVPQGSAATQTLIRSPRNKNFDIDAVCKVDTDRIDPHDPIGFFRKIGEALRARYREDVTAKNRCWNINVVGEGFYLEFTPSIPMGRVSDDVADDADKKGLRESPEPGYAETALGVVDNKEKRWKPSNPEGFARWVNDAATLVMLKKSVEEAALTAEARVEPVPDQVISDSNLLKMAIRLFKRHRDMCVYRNNIPSEIQPISVILVTLITGAYEGLAALGQTYTHPVEVLVDIAELLPHMIEERNGEYWVANPTVEGENFAEKWNKDGGRRKDAFKTWGEALLDDLKWLLGTSDPEEAIKAAKEIFGVSDGTKGPDDKLTPKPTRKHPLTPVKKNNGLA